MKWLEIKVGYDSNDKILVIDLISSIFYNFGVQGVLIEDPSMEIYGCIKNEIPGSSKCNAVIGYLPMDKGIDQKLKLFKKCLKRLRKVAEIEFFISCREIADEDWAESWKAYFRPEKITKKIVVKPTWREYMPVQQETVIEIDPGMAFGIGTHPTTRLCVILIEKYLKPGQTFLDIGTGTGILLITAAKLGAGKGLGIDHDEKAVETGRANLRLNSISPKTFKINAGNLAEKAVDIYDVVAANILSEVILDLLSGINKVLKNQGLFICSGISVANQNKVVKKMKEKGFRIVEVCIKEEWIAIVGKLKSPHR